MKDITVKPLLNVYSSQMYEKCFIWKNSKMDFNYFLYCHDWEYCSYDCFLNAKTCHSNSFIIILFVKAEILELTLKPQTSSNHLMTLSSWNNNYWLLFHYSVLALLLEHALRIKYQIKILISFFNKTSIVHLT